MSEAIAYKNGLTKQQEIAARAKFSQLHMSLKELCRAYKLNYHTIHNVLRGISPHVEELVKALACADIEIKKREELLQSIPV
jgi:lambda repressor-like predicted transcriptional regulator